MNKLTKIEIGILSFLTLWWMFTGINVNTSLGQIYALFTIISIIYVLVDPKREISLKRDNNNVSGLIYPIFIGMAAYALLLILGTFVILPGTKAILDLLASSTPILSTSVLVNKINFGIMVALTETFFFFIYGYDLLASLVGIEIDKKNLTRLKLWLVIFAICFAFAFFHLQAKMGGSVSEGISTLTLVWFMALISLLLVTWFKSGDAALHLHWIANSVAIGLIPFGR